METEQELFETLFRLDVTGKIEKKKNLSYLSWAWAWAEFKKQCPTATYKVWRDPQTGDPFTTSHTLGHMVYTEVTVGELTHSMWLPVMDHNNNAMRDQEYEVTYGNGKTQQVKAATYTDINKTIMRCLVKNLAMFGLGLHIYAGDDLPESPPADDVPPHKIIVIGGKYDGLMLGDIATKCGYAGKGYLLWLSRQSDSPIAAEAGEVWEAHKPEISDTDVEDQLLDCEDIEEVKGLFRCLSDKQKKDFQSQFATRKAEIKPDQRDPADARS